MTNINLKTVLTTLTVLLITFNLAHAQLHVVKNTDPALNGAVGIGTDIPTEKLDVDGNIYARQGKISIGAYANADNTNQASVLLLGAGRNLNGPATINLSGEPNKITARFISNGSGLNGTTASFHHYGSGVFNLRTWNSLSNIQFVTTNSNGNPVQALTIKPNGTVSIGTTNPDTDALLQVQGVAKKPGGGDWAAVSDIRTKKNINQYNKGLTAVLQLNPVTYNYNGKAGMTDTETTHVGLIAQEFTKIEPNAVKTFNHTDTISNKTNEFLSMDATAVKYMLVNAVKEQQALIEAQKAELETLKETVANLAKNGVAQTTPNATELSVLLEGTGTEKALLAQNTPNPFTTSTRIEYFIPANSRNARMSFRDMTGKEIKRVELTHDGIGAIELSAKDLAAGIYSYVLYVDGNIAASKKMVLKQ